MARGVCAGNRRRSDRSSVTAKFGSPLNPVICLPPLILRYVPQDEEYNQAWVQSSQNLSLRRGHRFRRVKLGSRSKQDERWGAKRARPHVNSPTVPVAYTKSGANLCP